MKSTGEKQKALKSGKMQKEVWSKENLSND